MPIEPKQLIEGGVSYPPLTEAEKLELEQTGGKALREVFGIGYDQLDPADLNKVMEAVSADYEDYRYDSRVLDIIHPSYRDIGDFLRSKGHIFDENRPPDYYVGDNNIGHREYERASSEKLEGEAALIKTLRRNTLDEDFDVRKDNPEIAKEYHELIGKEIKVADYERPSLEGAEITAQAIKNADQLLTREQEIRGEEKSKVDKDASVQAPSESLQAPNPELSKATSPETDLVDR